jgi:TPR repeat protein
MRTRQTFLQTILFLAASSLIQMAVENAAVAGPCEDVDLAIQMSISGDPEAHRESVKLLRRAAEQGYAGAQVLLGSRYDDGKGVDKHAIEAAKWYRRAAEQGHSKGQWLVGDAYAFGEGVPKNLVEAAKWYRRAAEQGVQFAQHNLGVMYFSGEGVPQDYVLAYLWFNLAAAAGNDDAKKNRLKVERRMTATQIADAQKLSREWKPKLEPKPKMHCE